jgi:hypothetical protein
MQRKLLCIISVGFKEAAGLLLLIYSAFVRYLNKREYNEAVHQLFINNKKAYDSVSMEVLCNILIECGIHMTLVKVIKMCPIETYCTVRVGKRLSDMFRIQSGL